LEDSTDTATVTDTPEPEVIDQLILEAVAGDPDRVWGAEAIVDATHLTMLDCLVGLARLTRAGQIERRAPGRYRHQLGDPAATAAAMRRSVLGTC
jgi:hypothetical protein